MFPYPIPWCKGCRDWHSDLLIEKLQIPKKAPGSLSFSRTAVKTGVQEALTYWIQALPQWDESDSERLFRHALTSRGSQTRNELLRRISGDSLYGDICMEKPLTPLHSTSVHGGSQFLVL